jgi:O-antigen ligase
MADAIQRPAAVWPRGQRPGLAQKASAVAQQHAPRLAFWLLVVFLVLEYARPPVVVKLKIQMLLIVLLPLMWLFSRERPWTPILTLQGLFVLCCAKSLPIARNWFALYFTTRVMYGNFAISLAITWVASHLRDFRRLLWVWLALMSYQAVFALSHGGKGSGGFLGDENDLALACGTALPFALAGLERLRGTTRWLLGGVAVLLLLAIVASFSRGGFVGLVLMVGYLWLTSRYKLRSLAVILAGALLLYATASQEYIDEMSTIRNTEQGTAQSRKFLWTAAYNMWRDHPLLGVGASNSTFWIGRYQPTDWEGRDFNERDWSGTALHSAWLMLLAEHGVVGVVLFLLLLSRQVLLIRRLRKDVRARSDVPDELARQVECFSVGVNGAIAGFIGSATFLSVLYYPYVWYFTALSAALDLAVRRELAQLDRAAPKSPAAAA